MSKEPDVYENLKGLFSELIEANKRIIDVLTVQARRIKDLCLLIDTTKTMIEKEGSDPLKRCDH